MRDLYGRRRQQAMDEERMAQADLMRQLTAYKQHVDDFSKEHSIDQNAIPNKPTYVDNTPVGTPEQEMNTLKSQLMDLVSHNKEVMARNDQEMLNSPMSLNNETRLAKLPKFNKVRSLVKPI